MSRSARAGTGCLIAVGVPFVAVGIYAGNAAYHLHAHYGWTRMVFWLACGAFAFAFAGFGLMAIALWGRKRVFFDDDLRAQHPDQPWMWHPEWVARRLSDQSRAGTFLLWAFALFWNAIATPIALMFVPDAIRNANPLGWLALLFPLAGIVMLINAVRLTLRWLRFRQSTLILDTMPVPIGGTLRGSVDVPHPLTSTSGVMIRLIAMAQRKSGSSTESTIACHEERELDPGLLRQTASGTIIPIEITVPSDAPATDTTDAQNNVFWRLNVDVEMPGIDYSATFDVPVFKTAFSDFRPHGAPAPLSAPIDPKSFVEQHTPEGRELHFPRFGAPSRAFVSLLFTIAWLGAIALMIISRVPIVIPIGFGIIAILLILHTLELFFESRTILLGAHDVTVRRLLLAKTERIIPYSDIASAKAVTSVTGHGARPYYHVDIETTAGKTFQAATNIHSKREAEWVASRIKARN